MSVPDLSSVDPFDESKGYYSKEEEALVKMSPSALLAELAAFRAANERLQMSGRKMREVDAKMKQQTGSKMSAKIGSSFAVRGC